MWVGGRGKGRPCLRWKDCVERDFRRAGGMVIGGSVLWIDKGGELWPMMQQSVSIVFFIPSLGIQEVEREL